MSSPLFVFLSLLSCLHPFQGSTTKCQVSWMWGTNMSSSLHTVLHCCSICLFSQ
jgi:hypothetical protein